MRGSVAREMLRDSREIPVVDVRVSAARSLAGAVVIPLSELPGRLGELDRYRSTPVVVVGDDGDSGRQACELLAGGGFKYVIYVSEGAAGLFAGVRGADVLDPAPEDQP
jgi:rhodanese-related sulfurtransferase